MLIKARKKSMYKKVQATYIQLKGQSKGMKSQPSLPQKHTQIRRFVYMFPQKENNQHQNFTENKKKQQGRSKRNAPDLNPKPEPKTPRNNLQGTKTNERTNNYEGKKP